MLHVLLLSVSMRICDLTEQLELYTHNMFSCPSKLSAYVYERVSGRTDVHDETIHVSH